jgi:hypothetical protein
MLAIHHEIKNVTPGPTTPAFVRLALGIALKGGILVIVKRTKRLIPRTDAAQRQVLADQGDNVNRVLYGG